MACRFFNSSAKPTSPPSTRRTPDWGHLELGYYDTDAIKTIAQGTATTTFTLGGEVQCSKRKVAELLVNRRRRTSKEIKLLLKSWKAEFPSPVSVMDEDDELYNLLSDADEIVSNLTAAISPAGSPGSVGLALAGCKRLLEHENRFLTAPRAGLLEHTIQVLQNFRG